MPSLFLSIFRFVRLLLSGHGAVAMENAALRLQLAAFQRMRKRPALTTFDRLFWVGLSRVWRGWRSPLLYVKPDTVIRWQRERFRRFWAWLSQPQRRRRGRPTTAAEIRRLIEQMAAANPLWRAPRIHGELKMLGIAVSERTVSRILRTLRRPPTQTWKTFSSQPPRPTGVDRFLHRANGHHESAVRVPRVGTSSSPGVAYQCDRASHCGLDIPTDRRGLRRSGCAALSPTRSGWHLRQRSSSADRVTAHGRGTNRTAESLAESVCRTPNRFHTQRLLEPFRDCERQASEENPGFVFRLLPWVEYAFGARQTMPISSAGLEDRKDT